MLYKVRFYSWEDGFDYEFLANENATYEYFLDSVKKSLKSIKENKNEKIKNYEIDNIERYFAEEEFVLYMNKFGFKEMKYDKVLYVDYWESEDNIGGDNEI
jgi:hypothetical protein